MQHSIQVSHGPILIPPPVLASREIGANLEFQGIVREQEQGTALEGLYYEAHEPMARRLLDRALHRTGGAASGDGCDLHSPPWLGARR